MQKKYCESTPKNKFFYSCILKQVLFKMSTMDLTPDKITKILTRFTERYMHFYNHKNPETINLGECFVWAWSVYRFMQQQGFYCELVTCRSHGGHAWVIVNGVAYDSEHLEGCDSDDLAFDFINQDDDCDRNDADIYIDSESDFLEFWCESGVKGYMLEDQQVTRKNLRSLTQISIKA